MTHRPEIDGLRAVAVLPVLLFHGGVAGFSGGFVGVDIFFVIGGYLITSIILADLEAGRFSLRRFYERRARRILPALFMVAICSFGAGLWLLSPRAMQGLSESLSAMAAFGSNILFWKQSGYFDTANELKPLLHTWSLALEEQFYLLFPLLLAWAWRRGRAPTLWLLAGLSLISFLVALWGVVHRPAATFYLLPTRAWELLMGSIIALRVPEPEGTSAGGAAAREMAGLLGLTLIGVSVVTLDHATPFPGLAALFPTVGTALVIWCARPSTVAGRPLGQPVLVGIGLISYSAYLWHQPLLAFARTAEGGPRSGGQVGTTLTASLGLAYVSWRWIERPFRQTGWLGQRTVFKMAGAGTVVLGGVGLIGHWREGFPERYPQLIEVRRTFEGLLGRAGTVRECYSGPRKAAPKTCLLPATDTAVTFVALGDSHLFTLHEGFAEAAGLSGRTGAWISGEACLPFHGVLVLRDGVADQRCAKLVAMVRDMVDRHGIGDVFLVARWDLYLHGQVRLTAGPGRGGSATTAESRALFEEGMAMTVEGFEKLGARVTVVLQVPEQRRSPEELYADLARLPAARRSAGLREASVSPEDVRQRQEVARQIFARVQVRSQLRILSLDATFCETGRCLIGLDGRPFYVDTNHLSVEGARRAAPAITDALRQERPPA